MVALNFVKAVAPFEHAIELIDHQSNGLVAFVRRFGDIEIGSVNGHMTFSNESTAHRLFRIAFQLHADAYYALLVSKQSLHFFTNERFEGGREFEVNAGNDQFVLVVLSVHSYFIFWV